MIPDLDELVKSARRGGAPQHERRTRVSARLAATTGVALGAAAPATGAAAAVAGSGGKLIIAAKLSALCAAIAVSAGIAYEVQETLERTSSSARVTEVGLVEQRPAAPSRAPEPRRAPDLVPVEQSAALPPAGGATIPESSAPLEPVAVERPAHPVRTPAAARAGTRATVTRGARASDERPAEEGEPSTADRPPPGPRETAAPSTGPGTVPEVRRGLDVLRTANEALQAGDPRRALEVLGSRLLPTSLEEERIALVAIARCGTGGTRAERRAIARTFLAEHGRSVLAGRVTRACEAGESDDRDHGPSSDSY